jgi:hypothetical protein
VIIATNLWNVAAFPGWRNTPFKISRISGAFPTDS